MSLLHRASFSYVLLLITLSFAEEAKRFDGFQVLKATVTTEEQYNALQTLVDEDVFDFWTLPSMHVPVDIMGSPQNIASLKDFLNNHNIKFEVKLQDVQSTIEESMVTKGTHGTQEEEEEEEDTEYELNWDEYHRTEVILDYITYLETNYEFVSTEILGQSTQGRDIVAVKITKAGDGYKNVYIDGTVHGREWISPAVVTYLMRELVENHQSHDYIDNLNFYIIPIVNPDGYEHTFSSNRLWRKTRTTEHSESCPGVDLNRNFPFQFAGPGSSGDVCSDAYRGPEAFSEPEAVAIEKLFKSVDPVPELALTYHSAVNAYLFPYGYTNSVKPDNDEELVEVCEEAMAALNEVDGQSFICLRASDLYPVGGNAMDWMDKEGTRFSYIPELRDNGYGFLLPPKYIKPSGEENWAALEVLLDKLLE